MKVAVTGATGGLGQAIVELLSDHPDKPEIVGICRNPGKVSQPAIEYRQGDYSEKHSYQTALKGIDAVLLVSGMDDPQKRVQQHRNVIESAVENGVTKIVYTSIVGNPTAAGFSPVVASNRQTEEDVRNSGLKWSIGRNGLYIEPDIEYVEHYIRVGKIANCGAAGRCAYTTRSELASAYTEMLMNSVHDGQSYNLVGPAITQAELTDLFNRGFGLDLRYEPMTVEAYKAERIAELGEFMGTIISGIYEGIRAGYSDVESDFARAAGRPHLDWETYFMEKGAEFNSSQQ